MESTLKLFSFSKNFFLLDWLLDRRHCDLKWQNDALEVREKINAAIQDMPPVDEITELLSGSCEYFSVNIVKPYFNFFTH